MVRTLLTLLAVLASGGVPGKQTDTRGGPNSCAASLAATDKPAVCISTPHQSLTLNRTGGHIHIYVTIETAHTKGPVNVKVSSSSPANASGVLLEEGKVGLMKEVTVRPGSRIVDMPLLLVQTGSTNLQSGHISYTIIAWAADSAKSPISVLGVPITVDVQTIP